MSSRDKGRDTTPAEHVHLLILGLLTDSPSATPRSLTSDHIRSDSVTWSGDVTQRGPPDAHGPSTLAPTSTLVKF